MSYSRVTPRARSGTSGISEEFDLTAGNGAFITVPDRIAAVTVAVHIPSGSTGTFTIETCCNRSDTIGDNGTGGYWDNPYGDGVTISENTTVMIANAITAIRVNCVSASTKINVCFVG